MFFLFLYPLFYAKTLEEEGVKTKCANYSDVRKKKKKQSEVQTKDIHKFFNRGKTISSQPERTSNEEEQTNKTIIIKD